MIYLHGSDPSTPKKMSAELLPAAKGLFGYRDAPMVIVMPGLNATKFPSYTNLHIYTNSEYCGNYEDAM